MFVNYKTSGIFLKKIDKGEANQLFTIYTKDFGRLEVMGKGIRKMASKLRSQTRILSFSDIEFIQGKAGKTLTDSRIKEKFEKISLDLDKTETAEKIVGLVALTVRGEERDEKSWQLLLETLYFLKKTELRESHAVYQYFFWNFMAGLGYRPQLDVCCFCLRKLANEIYFEPAEGGISCKSCRPKGERDCPIDAGILRILRVFEKSDLEAAARIKFSLNQKNKLETISTSFLSTIL